jgi:hypothetical protein
LACRVRTKKGERSQFHLAPLTVAFGEGSYRVA